MLSPKISVIIPVYNVEKYVVEAVKSIQTQSYKNLEILVIDDGSTDKSLQLVQELALEDQRIKLITKPNGGHSSARNLGLKIASGDFISFFDSDDILRTDAYELLIQQIEKHKLSLITFGMSLYFKDTIIEKEEINTNNSYCEIISKSDFFRLLFDDSYKNKYCKAGYTCNKLYRRDILVGLSFNEKRRYHEDEELIFDIYSRLDDKTHRIGFVDRPLYFYRQRSSSIMHENRLPRLFALYSCRRAAEKKFKDSSLEQQLIHQCRVSVLFKIMQLSLSLGRYSAFKRIQRIVFSSSSFSWKTKFIFMLGRKRITNHYKRKLSNHYLRRSKLQYWE